MTIAFDFDNVIHKYRKGWHDGTIYDELTRSRFQIKNHFNYLNDSYDTIYDRLYNGIGIIPFKYQTFGLFGKFWNKKNICGITNRKAIFDVLIDDRAINFNPQNGISINQILSFNPIKYK